MSIIHPGKSNQEQDSASPRTSMHLHSRFIRSWVPSLLGWMGRTECFMLKVFYEKRGCGAAASSLQPQDANWGSRTSCLTGAGAAGQHAVRKS